MEPIRCPACKLHWYVRDDVSGSITCPRCLTLVAVPKPNGGPTQPPPLPILPLDHEVARDAKASSIGVWIVAALFAIAMIVGLQDARYRRDNVNVRIALAITAAATVAMAIVGACSGRLNDFGVGASIAVGVVASGCLTIVLIALGLLALVAGLCSGAYKGL